MYMPVQHDCARMLVFVKENRVVTENRQPILIVDLRVLLDAFPVRTELSFYTVMVALNQVLMSLQPLHDPDAVFFVFPERIAQHIDGVVRCDPLIPVLNQHLVHLLCVRKRAVVEVNDIFMTEVHICNIVNHCVSLSLFVIARTSSKACFISHHAPPQPSEILPMMILRSVVMHAGDKIGANSFTV